MSFNCFFSVEKDREIEGKKERKKEILRKGLSPFLNFSKQDTSPKQISQDK